MYIIFYISIFIYVNAYKYIYIYIHGRVPLIGAVLHTQGSLWHKGIITSTSQNVFIVLFVCSFGWGEPRDMQTFGTYLLSHVTENVFSH